jgi:hypothetical protein
MGHLLFRMGYLTKSGAVARRAGTSEGKPPAAAGSVSPIVSPILSTKDEQPASPMAASAASAVTKPDAALD